MSQRNRILSMLEQAGPAGVHSFELYEAHSLKAEGFRIDSTHEVFHGGAKGVRYRLVGALRATPPPVPSGPPEGLFTPPRASSAVSPYDVAA